MIRDLGSTTAHEATIHNIGLSVLAMPEGKERKPHVLHLPVGL